LFIPNNSIGVEGFAISTFSPLSFINALVLPQFFPLTKKSPFFNDPEVTITVAIGPLPVSILDSKIIPFASVSSSAFKSSNSA